VTTLVDRPQVVDALAATWASLAGVLRSLEPGDWKRPTALPGWDVQANVSHIIGTEAMLAGQPTPAATIDRAVATHVRNDIGELNEAWVVALAGETPAAMLARFDELTTARLATLGAMTDAEWDADGFTPAGRDSYGRFMRIRVFDCWLHEQDIRDAVGRPGHESGPAVVLTLDELATGLGFVVGKRAAAPPGLRLTIEATGASGRTFHVEVGERAVVVPALSGPPTVTLAMPVGVLTRLAAGRVRSADVAGRVMVTGDRRLADAVLANLAFTI
jgi:uncharacterized protein (TIGR03083 family)